LKAAFIAGFYEPVRKALTDRFPKQMEVSSLVWIKQVAPNREADLGMFGSQLAHKLTNGARKILVMVAVLAGKGWVEETVRAIVAEQKEIHPNIEIELCFEQKAADAALVVQKVADFNLPEPSEVSVALLRSKLAGEQVLCVVMDGQCGFPEALSRAGFPPECICEEFFVDMVISCGKNSNLMDLLYKKADQYRHILYAWTGLRHMPGTVKKRYTGAMFVGPTAKDAVSLLKRWLLER
jgi:hypothetical protein